MHPLKCTRAPAILLLVTGLGVGGAERMVLDLARGCQQRGHRVVVVSLTGEDSLLQVIDASGLDIRLLRMPKTARGFAQGVSRLRRILRNEEIDLVHAHMPHAAILASAVRLRMPELKVIHTSHNFGGISWQQRMALIALRRWRDVDVLLAPGQHPAINAARTIVIPNGIPIDQAAPPDSGPRLAAPLPDDAGKGPLLLAIGRLSEQKDFGTLIDAFGQWRARRTDEARLWIAGDGPQREALQARILAAGLDGPVRLLGIRSDIPALLASADAFVMSSRWEGLPLVVLEAGAAGVPVIAPPVGALPWLLGDDRGWLAEPASLAQALDACFGDPSEAGQRAERLRTMVREQFTHERFIDAHLALYRQLDQA